ncbi:Hsp70 family protein [Streptomyces parvus]|uniref:Hsp70 family protein n=1 Tax=Streptomyces parvus TaxID=66428 RepID=UPI0034052428
MPQRGRGGLPLQPDEGRRLRPAARPDRLFGWGGSTIDVTVLEYGDGLFEEQTSLGITALGGLEFDNALAKMIGGASQIPRRVMPWASSSATIASSTAARVGP